MASPLARPLAIAGGGLALLAWRRRSTFTSAGRGRTQVDEKRRRAPSWAFWIQAPPSYGCSQKHQRRVDVMVRKEKCQLLIAESKQRS